MKSRKKQIIFLVCIILLVIIGAVFFAMKADKDPLSSDYQESEREDTVFYGGREYEYNEHLSNFLFLGIDTTISEEKQDTKDGAGQADSIFLLSYNRKENTVKCLVIPRDTQAYLQKLSPDGVDLGLAKDHLSVQYAYGDGKRKSCELMEGTVSRLLYGVPIQGYCALNMDGIPVATQVIGGVELIVPDSTLESVNAEFKQGAKVLITEENAEQFVRYRDTKVSQSAIARMKRQITFVEAFSLKTKELATKDDSFVVKMLDSVEDYLITNIGNDMFAKMVEATYNAEEIVIVPGEGVKGEVYDEYHVDEDALYELVLQMFYKEVQGD